MQSPSQKPLDFNKLADLDEAALTLALSKIIKRYRAKRGLSRDQLAFMLNLHKNTLYGIEVGIKHKSGRFARQQITMLNFIHLAAFFKMEIGELLNEILELAFTEAAPGGN